MNIDEQYHFLHTIFKLRKNEDLVLYSRMAIITDEELQLVGDLLEEEYKAENLSYPTPVPPYDQTAALWAARILYTVAQLILYRVHKSHELAIMLVPYAGSMTSAAILSADLCLRFLPQLSIEVRNIDADDALLKEIDNILQLWHYSGIGQNNGQDQIDFGPIFADTCLTHLYADRIIERKHRRLAQTPEWAAKIDGILGIHQKQFWQGLK